METGCVRLPTDALVVLAGPSASGKSTWANRWFRPGQVVSSDVLRGVVGEHQHDLRASDDAFALVDQIVERRLRRGLLTVIDSLGMDRERLDAWLAMANDHGRTSHLVTFNADAATCRRRNKSRANSVPAKVLTAQLKKWTQVQADLEPGFTEVHEPGTVSVVPASLLATAEPATRHLNFGLLVSAFDWPDDEPIRDRLGNIAAEAEHAGFESIWVMDHFMQIPQVGREWDPMLESYSTLAYLAAKTSRVGLGALVSCVTHRSLGHLGKTIATLDVLSGGRARCGLGLGWFEREHRAFGYEFPSTAERYELLEDALQFLPLQWGPGAPEFVGHRFSSPEAIGYPRPLQPKIPILVGGSGEKRTLRLAAQYADACNLFGEPDVLAHKVSVLRDHCDELGRDPADVEVTQLSNVLVGVDQADLTDRIGALSHGLTAEQFVTRTNGATVDAHVDRFARIADAGVDTVMVSLADIGLEGSATNFGQVIDHFR
jgi:F420-dependent oxidoreductase-like protein